MLPAFFKRGPADPIAELGTLVPLMLMCTGLATYFLNKYVGHGFVVVGAVLCLISMLAAPRLFWQRTALPPSSFLSHIWPIGMGLYVISMVVSLLLHGGEQELKRAHEAFEIVAIGVAVYYFFLRNSSQYSDRIVLVVFSIGLLLTGGASYLDWINATTHQRLWLGTGMINISAGTQLLLVSALLGMIIVGRFTKWVKLILIAGVLFGSIGILASGSRGAWIGLLGSFLIAGALAAIHWKKPWVILVGLLLSLATVWLSVEYIPQVKQRIEQGQRDLHAYIEGNPRTSLGYRLEMWRSAVDGFVEHPVIGMGSGTLGERWKGIDHTYQIMNYSPHVHNDLLESAQSRGVLGLFSTLFVFIAPLLIGWKNKSSTYGAALVTSVSGFTVACLFDSHLIMKFAFFYYIVLISLLAALAIGAKREFKTL